MCNALTHCLDLLAQQEEVITVIFHSTPFVHDAIIVRLNLITDSHFKASELRACLTGQLWFCVYIIGNCNVFSGPAD